LRGRVRERLKYFILFPAARDAHNRASRFAAILDEHPITPCSFTSALTILSLGR